jgi:peptide/nickel transport system permease protein
MYAGQVAETGDTRALLTDPAHHYTRGLLGSVTSLEAGAARLHQVHGVVPAPQYFGAGCRFASRCEAATELCRTQAPALGGRPGALVGAGAEPGRGVEPGAGAEPRGGAELLGEAGRHGFACHHPAEPVLLQRSGR